MAKPKAKKGDKLTMAQQLFCYFFTGLYFNNATRSYAAAYNINLDEYDRLSTVIAAYAGKAPITLVAEFDEAIKRYKVASAGGIENLEKPSIQKRVHERLLEKYKDLDKVDFEHAKVIFQDNDLPSKMRGIAEFNKLKGRITEKHVHQHGFSLTDILNEADKE